MGKTLGYGEITVANMTEPFTVMLTNEAQQFATDSNRKVTSAQSYYTDIIVIRGSQERTDYTIGNITSGSGITVSKNSKRVTFSVSAGTTIGADAGVIEIPITLDGQTVKKQFSWSCGKQGPQGVKGDPGTSVKITSKSVTYQTSTSGTTAPTGTWSTTVPTVNNGQYLWTKTTVQYSDGNKTEAYSVSYKGTNGTNGTSVTVSKTEVTYQVSASGTTAPTGTWSTTMPSFDQGQYLWTKTYVKYSDGKDTTSYSVSYKGVDGEKFAFNMLRETNQGSKHWVNLGASGKYSVESITTDDNINAAKLICTEAIASNEWQFCDFSDYEMLKSLKASTTYTLSYDIKANRSGKILHNIKTGGGQKVFFANDIACKVLGNETWEHVSLKMTSGTTLPNLDGQVIYMFGDALSKVGYSIIKNLKLTESTTDTPWAPHPEDLEGRGVSETIQYYLATSQASGVTSSTSGWSTDITTQKLTADKKYLWNCYQTKYSDGTSEPISTPKVIGVYGDKGQKGENAKNLSITPSSQYFKSTDGGKTFAPNTITIKPTIQGEISFGKWQYSIDGGVSFADVVSGQKGLTISNNVLSISKDSGLYSDAVTMVTFRAVANDSSFYDTCSIAKIYDVSDIGDGRNLIQKSQLAPIDSTDLNLDDYSKNGTVVFINKSVNSGFSFDKYNNYQSNSKYVLSYYFTKTSGTINSFGGFHNGKRVVYTSFFVDDKVYDTASYAGGSSQIGTILNDGKRHRIVVCYTTPDTIATDTSVNYTFIQPGRGNTNPNFGVKIEELKLEKGSSPTGWSAAPEDLQTAILSTKSEISDVSLKVDKNKQAIEQRVEKTTYQQDLNLVKGDISKANEGLNKWRYEIYPKSLFASEYQGKSTMDVFAKNTNLTPSQSVLINDTDFGKSWAYGDNYIGYALTFVKFSAAKSIAITFKHDDGAHLYLNGKLIGGDDTCNTGSGESLTLSFIQGWNCLEVVLNEKSGGEYIGLGTTISAISECQLMNCYYGTPVARQSHITNQLVENTTNIDGVSGSVQKVMSTVGGSSKIDEFVNNYSTWKKKVDGIETRVGETYTTKDDFNGLEIGGRNLVRLGGLSGNGATSFSYDKTTDTYTIVSPVVSTVWGTGAAVKYDDNHKVLIPYGKTYILSFEVKVPQALSINIDINNYAVSGSSWAGNDNDDGSTRGQSSYSIPANTWTKVWVRWANTNTKNTNKVDLYDNSSIGLVTKDCTSAVTWQIRHVKGELGNKPTDWTPAPEDVNGKIVNVETIANQTAKKFEWIVKGGDSSSNFTLTDRVADLVAERINFKGLVTFSGTTNLIENSNMMNGLANITSECKAIKVIDDSTYRKALVITPIAGGRIFWGVANVWKANITYTVSFVAKSSVAGQKIKPSRSVADWGDEITLTTSYVKYTTRIKSTATADGGTLSFSFSNAIGDVTLTNVKLETGMNPTDWSPAPGDYITQASLVRNWTTNTTWINGGKIYTGSITADKIATDAIKSRNYISSGGTQGSFLNLSDGSFQSPNLSWDANGNLIAKNANLSGEITATNGSIAGWTIISNKMYTTGSGKYTGIGKYGSAYAFWAGATSNDNGNSAVFKVSHTGKLTATDADITGTITATNGKIGRYDITSTYLMTNSGSNASGIGGNQAFWAGAEDSNSAPFRVGYDGVLWAENAAIRGSIETGNLGDEGDTVSIINGHIGIQGTSNNVEIYSTGFKFGIDGDYYLMSVSEGVKCYRNLYATDFVADGWLYCSEVHSSGAVVIGADSESFYWAHGYQIARGTSWGGVCVGDDSQQLRLYGSSIWASHSISTSDENLKENFTTLDQYENFYMNLNPIGFNYIGDYDGKKTHFGFGAHKTEDVLESEGYDADKFAVVTHRPLVQEDIEKRFGKDVEVDIETEYGVSYTEFIALNTHMIQKTRRELTKVKQEKADLEVRLQAIEAKLGL